jgi:hypothetical protein
MSMERFFAQNVQKRLGMRMGGAMRKRATREAARGFNHLLIKAAKP